MSDLIEIEECIIEKIIDLGTIVSRGDLTRDDPLLLNPNQESAVVVQVATYERFNGSHVLSLDVALESISRNGILCQKLIEMTQWLPFCSVRFENTDNNKCEAFLTHSLLIDDNLSTEQIEQSIGSMVHTFKTMQALFQHISDLESEINHSEIEEPEFIARDLDDDNDLGIEEKKLSTNLSGTSRRIAPSGISTLDALDTLNKLVGLEPVKKMVHQLVARQRVEKLRARVGMKAVLPSPHLVFTGNPGTGKTTVAQLIGELYLSLGILEIGHVVEVNRSGLVAAYVGQTALKTRAACTAALGGVLFIDEAYALVGEGLDFGAEAIEELLTFMEGHRGEFVVVAAGYPKKMEEFLSSNPGLRSRFDTVIHFPDFSNDELLTIFEKLVTENDYTLHGAGIKSVEYLIRHMKRGESFGNAREMRRLFNNVLDIHASRLGKYERPGKTMLSQLNGLDFFPMLTEQREQLRGNRAVYGDAPRGKQGFNYGGYL